MLDLQALGSLGIDVDEGLAYCADDPEFYEEMLGEYRAEGRAKLDELRRFYESRDWGNYAIRAHSAKSTSKMIGAKALSEKARELEMAGKAQDEPAVAVLHEPFVREYGALLDQLDALLG
jgi:HPt (histidine-containing phosphotransfer) domain-containing protein